MNETFTFNGINSGDYGVYIGGDAVYNAPARVVEMVAVPGRNGALAMDEGRYENIEVTYPAFLADTTQADFASRVSELRNALCAVTGYQRLVDDYNPNEYRLAVYKSGLEVSPTQYNRAGGFDITFECKPQRFLVSGEDEWTGGEWGETETVTGEIVTLTASAADAVKTLSVTLEPQQEGSGTPSPTNVRPISGTDEVRVYRTGKNLLPPAPNVWSGVVYSDGYYNVNLTTTGVEERRLFGNWGIQNAVSFGLKEGDYIWRNTGISVDGGAICTCSVRVSQHGTQSYQVWNVNSTRHIYDDDKFFILLYFGTANTYYKCKIGIQLELGSTVTDYEPYEGTTYTTALGQTVYGGTLDVTSGVLTVTGAEIASYSGQSINEPWLSSMDEYVSGATPTTGAQVVYELATPTTYQLTPSEVTLLLGENVLWSNGDSITVEYGMDPYIIENPTRFASSPLLKVTGTGTVGIGSYSFTLEGTSEQTVYIDCEVMEAWTLAGTAKVNANDLVQYAGNTFPKLEPGLNTVSLGSGISEVVITPRWWKL